MRPLEVELIFPGALITSITVVKLAQLIDVFMQNEELLCRKL